MATVRTLPEIRCTDGCGATGVDDPACTDPQAVQVLGWRCLQITGRWRCPSCVRLLEDINQRSAP